MTYTKTSGLARWRTNKMSTAQALAGPSPDGRSVLTVEGVDFEEECLILAGRPSYRDGHGTDTYRYDFDDGSSIVFAGAAWDFGVSQNCFCWAGSPSDDCGHGAR